MTGPACRTLEPTAGSLASFPRYSPALKSAGILWNDDTLDEWIKDPQHFIAGNTMTFPGVKDGRQRADLLAFLKDATRPGRAPSVAAQGGGMMGMMGGGQVPDCRSSMPRIGYSRSIIAGTPTTSPRRTGRCAISGNGICASRPMSAATAHKKACRPSWAPE